ncbi:MAG TPA: phosphatidate cytidylyltransferase [Gemmataceae bacterium]|nr:phosphatidate cytidylyltransferase [Gemmataceae bacterium]
MGSVLVAVAVAVLVIDQRLDPWYPFLFLVVLGLSLAACFELLGLLGPERRPPAWLCYTAVAGLVVANWCAHVLPTGGDPWHWVLGTFTAVTVSAFLTEMAVFREPGYSVVRIALAVWIAAYVGLLPSFLMQLRWLGGDRGTAALALTIFVPKCGDIGAYFTGRFLGRHRMTPVLSPKKTWEGLAGGLATAVAAAAGINYLGPAPLLAGVPAVVGFGITVGLAGVLGDLAESLIKRDCGQKDASQAVPGFGGVLDVVDAILFAAPVAYLWLR